MLKKLVTQIKTAKKIFFDVPVARKSIKRLYKSNENGIYLSKNASTLKRSLINVFVADGKLPSPKINAHSHLVQGSNGTDEIVEDLKLNGFHVIENFVPPEICKKVVSYAENVKSYPRLRDSHVSSSEQSLCKFEEPYLSARYDFSPNPKLIFQNQDLQALMSNSFLLSIAENYLGTRPFLDPVELWWFVPFADRDDGWAEEYHFDMDSPKWLKFFFNFEDIEIENGPHCFIEGTHADFGIPDALRKKGYSRISDEEVFSHVDRSLERVFTVKAGSLLIEDSRGLHKGLIPKSGRRLLFAYQLSNAVLIEEHDKAKRIDIGFETVNSFQNLLETYPRYFVKHFNGV